MKTTLLTTMALSCALAATAFARENNRGAIDFGTFDPPEDGEFVEINVGRGLISMAARLAAESEPEVAEALDGLKSIRVNVIGLNDDNRNEIQERVEEVRQQLDGAGWERLVTVKEGDEDVGISAKLRGEEAIEGVAITVMEGEKQAVFINVVGDVRPEQLAAVAERLHIKPLERIAKEFGQR